ncbi:hypothetical protein FSB84_00015 [Pseudobacter ginsenosidimutans]|uniref:hypothetical protein n=1 Tax=Pseudobacter ginsenosidimutans TaxID=661488 RepID=UPI0011BBF8C1|nr:hypothetical protein [Pseudobacter ginsenosidimutans]QEC40162.1 hypothetical protein FSB84_00015 [Pseudobacter ginsenosidimutans]
MDDVANEWFIGHPVRVSYDYRKIGIWQLADSTQAIANKQLPGDIRVHDKDGKGISAATVKYSVNLSRNGMRA